MPGCVRGLVRASACCRIDSNRTAAGVSLWFPHRAASHLAGQREDYLAKTLAEFKAGTRVGYTSAMNETLAAVDAQELPDLAHYLANVGPKR